MSIKQVNFGSESREKLKNGIDALANAVKVTLGPKGRNVIIERHFGTPHITKDGVTVAKEIELEDPFENMGAQLVKDVASRTNDMAGDGTTTATILAQAIVIPGLKSIIAGANPMDLKRGIDKATSAIVIELAKLSEKVGEDFSKIKQVGAISANNDENIGDIITNAMEKVGIDGVITVEESKGTDTYVDVVEGMQFDRGYVSPYFVTNPDNMECEMENPYILICDKRISSIKELLPVLEKVVQTGKGLIIIAEDIDSDALAALVVNRVRGSLKVAAVKSPGFGDRKKSILQDIAIITGGEVISEELGNKLEDAQITQLGTAEKILITKDSTTIINGYGKKSDINSRINQIKTQLEKSESDYDKEKLQERLAKLSGGVAVLYVGAISEIEMKEKKDRIDDALHATRAAVQEGIVPGGGVALIRASSVLDSIKGINEDEQTGIDIIKSAIETPLRQIAENGGVEGSIVVFNVKNGKKDYGYNAKTETYENLLKSGVIDPTKVTRIALENASSIASMILTTECSIVEKPVKEASIVNGMMQ